MRDSILKTKLRENRLTIGTWITIPHAAVVEILATAGFEWMVVDMEHSSIDFKDCEMLVRTIQSCGLEALVRVSKNDEVYIKRSMDIGANGVIVPMVNSKEDALRAREYLYYPPYGKRGVGLYRAQNYGIEFEKYKNWLGDNAVLICQIEHIKAVENIDEILGVDGVDGIIIGPYDLSGSMGYPGDYERDEVKRALERVKNVCFKANKPLGFHVIPSRAEALNEKIKQGYTFLAFSLDFYFLGDRARDEMLRVV